MARTAPTPEEGLEISKLGEALYAEKIRPVVEPDHHGERLVMDIDSEDYVLESRDDPTGAARMLLERNPDARLYRVRIGFRAASKIGGSWRMGER